MALILAVGGVADFFREGVIDVLQRAHHGRVHADVQRFEAVEIARRIEKAVDGFRIGALGFRQADHSAIGLGDHSRSISRIIDQPWKFFRRG